MWNTHGQDPEDEQDNDPVPVRLNNGVRRLNAFDGTGLHCCNHSQHAGDIEQPPRE